MPPPATGHIIGAPVQCQFSCSDFAPSYCSLCESGRLVHPDLRCSRTPTVFRYGLGNVGDGRVSIQTRNILSASSPCLATRFYHRGHVPSRQTSTIWLTGRCCPEKRIDTGPSAASAGLKGVAWNRSYSVFWRLNFTDLPSTIATHLQLGAR